MDGERLERWATTALYISGIVAAVVLLTRSLAPDGSWPQRLAQAAVTHLTELGSVSAGLLVLIILITLLGNRIMVSIFSGIDRYHEWKGKNAKIKAEAEAAGIEQGVAQGIEQGVAQGIEQGVAQGIEQGLAQGVEQGIEQGLAQGIEQGLAQGIEQGLAQGIEQGLAQGIEQGRAAERVAIRARLAELGLNPEDFLPSEPSETDDGGSDS